MPNPNDGNFQVNICLHEEANILLRIYNQNGNLIQENNYDPAEDFEIPYNLPQLEAGEYHLVLLVNGEWSVLTFIKT